MDRAAIERHLAALDTFENPRADLEQYTTPATLASRLIHLAALQDDLDRPVVDLGTGTGMLAIGAALAAAPRVIALDRDAPTLSTARRNERSVPTATTIDWLTGDATQPPLPPGLAVTVLMNPPFGAQTTQTHADRAFLTATADIAVVSYSIHNVESLEFLEAFTDDHDATITHAYAAEIDVPPQFPWHSQDRTAIPVELVRIEW